MPRSAREQSSTGVYHFILRGVNENPMTENEENGLLDVEETVEKTLLYFCNENNLPPFVYERANQRSYS